MTDGLEEIDPVDRDWWRRAVVYQVYLRSFADGNGDGVGDLRGLRARLDHVAELGADAIWVSPCYPSPMVDAGYDVSEPRDIDPLFGDLADLEALVADAHRRGLRVLLDIVPNHTSAAAPQFVAALAGDVEARRWYHFSAGRGVDGEQPPNNWTSHFGGPAWTRTTDLDGRPGAWYLHLFAPGQPDLNWGHPPVADDFETTLRFWFDRGVDGFRIDSANGLVKADGLPDADDPSEGTGHPAWDQDGIHDVYRRWRRVADSYDPPRIFVGEVWVDDPERMARYLRPDELHTSFQADLLLAPFRTGQLRAAIDHSPAAAALAGAPATWTLSNHDTVRHLTRFARSQPAEPRTSTWDRLRWWREPADLALGSQRARAAALMLLALPGTIYLYQGEELGLEEVEDLPSRLRQDPTWTQSGHTDPGRDGCRVPLPWAGDLPPFEFSTPRKPGAEPPPPWLPQPRTWTEHTASRQRAHERSMLSLYRSALEWRKKLLGGAEAFTWLDLGPHLLGWETGRLICVLNAEERVVPLSDARALAGATRILESAVDRSSLDIVPPATARWFRSDG